MTEAPPLPAILPCTLAGQERACIGRRQGAELAQQLLSVDCSMALGGAVDGLMQACVYEAEAERPPDADCGVTGVQCSAVGDFASAGSLACWVTPAIDASGAHSHARRQSPDKKSVLVAICAHPNIPADQGGVAKMLTVEIRQTTDPSAIWNLAIAAIDMIVLVPGQASVLPAAILRASGSQDGAVELQASLDLPLSLPLLRVLQIATSASVEGQGAPCAWTFRHCMYTHVRCRVRSLESFHPVGHWPADHVQSLLT